MVRRRCERVPLRTTLVLASLILLFCVAVVAWAAPPEAAKNTKPNVPKLIKDLSAKDRGIRAKAAEILGTWVRPPKRPSPR